MKENKKAILEVLRRPTQKAGKFESLVLNLALQKIDSEYFDFDGEAVYTVDRRRLVYCISNAETFSIPDGLEIVGEMAFRGKRNLRSVLLPASLRVIEKDAFYDCDSLTAVAIPAGVETVQHHAFAECDSLRTVTFHGQPRHLSRHAFSNDDNLETLSIPAGSRRYFAKELHLKAEKEELLEERIFETLTDARKNAGTGEQE